jgi:hypothetical protein
LHQDKSKPEDELRRSAPQLIFGFISAHLVNIAKD